VWQSFTKIDPGTSKNLWWEIKKDNKTPPKYNSLPLSLERYAGDSKKQIFASHVGGLPVATGVSTSVTEQSKLQRHFVA